MIGPVRWLLLTFLLSACGSAGYNDDDGGLPSCSMLTTVTPPAPRVGDIVDLDGSIAKMYLAGAEIFEFAVTFAGDPVPLEERDPFDGSRMSFVPAGAGPHSVVLRGSVVDGGVETSCADDVQILNVTDPQANVASFRFRFLPAPGQPAPAQERTFEIYGGADFELGSIGLDNGVAISGTVQDGASDPVPGYLRIRPSGGGADVETFAGAGGTFAARVGAGTHDVLLVPDDGARAPAELIDLAPSSLSSLLIPAGVPISGVVQDPAGLPLAGAQVALRIDGVPSTIATTDGAGAFTVLAQSGGAAAVAVTPPVDSGLPRLELPASAGLVAATGTALTIRYAADWTSRAVALAVRESDGTTPAAGATVVWTAGPIASAGTVTPEAGSPLAATGSVRLPAVADGSGQLAGLVLPETDYTAVILPPTTGSMQAALVAVDLSATSPTPATLRLAAPATLTGQVTGGGAPLAGARVHASPRGLLANLPQASASATTDAGGAYALQVAGDGQYQLSLLPRARTHVRALVDTTAPAAGASVALGATDLEPAIRVGGWVTISGLTNAAGVAVEVYCVTCSGPAALVPVAEAVTDGTGRFVVAVPDPGTQ